MNIIALANLKGGCAKTTTVVNLAACLAELHKRVLVIDLDPQGNSSEWLSEMPTFPLGALELFTGKTPIIELIFPTACEGVSLIASSPDLSSLDKLLAGELAVETILKRRLSELNPNHWDYILVDTPPMLGLVTLNALAAADNLIVPVTTHILTLAGVAQLLGVIEKIKSVLNPKLKLLGFLPSRVDLRTRHSRDVLETMKDHFAGQVFTSHIRENIRLAEAPSYKKPIIAYDGKCGAAADFRSFTQEMLKLI